MKLSFLHCLNMHICAFNVSKFFTLKDFFWGFQLVANYCEVA